MQTKNKICNNSTTMLDNCQKCNSDNPDYFDEIEIINHFQPIVSVSENKIIAYETLCRGLCKHCHSIIPPLELFSRLESEDDIFKIDLKARENAIKIFNEILSRDKDKFLFVNFNAHLIEKGIDSPEILVNFCKDTSVNPSNIVIEITESNPCDLSKLLEFVKNCKEYGFLVALDDVGTGYSNFDRISHINPDIIKLDRTIIQNLDKEHSKKVIFRSMARLANKIGILLLAEGIETEGEALYSVELGSDFLQGFYFSKPIDIKNNQEPELGDKLFHIKNLYKEYKVKIIKELKENHAVYNKVVTNILKQLEEIDEAGFEDLLVDKVNEYDFIESAYVINSDGAQITNSIFNCKKGCRVNSKIYHSLKIGDSHSYKEYFYLLKEGILEKYTTDVYFSNVTGEVFKTISNKLTSKDNQQYVLCINLKQ